MFSITYPCYVCNVAHTLSLGYLCSGQETFDGAFTSQLGLILSLMGVTKLPRHSRLSHLSLLSKLIKLVTA